jgi:hypothetical protein
MVHWSQEHQDFTFFIGLTEHNRSKLNSWIATTMSTKYWASKWGETGREEENTVFNCWKDLSGSIGGGISKHKTNFDNTLKF